jgi:hypothetical protein
MKKPKANTSHAYTVEYQPPNYVPDLSPFLCWGDVLLIHPDSDLVQGDWCRAVVQVKSLRQPGGVVRSGVYGRAYAVGEMLLVYLGRDERTGNSWFERAESAERIDAVTDSSGRARFANGGNGDSRDSFEVARELADSHWTRQPDQRHKARKLAADLGRVYLRERRWARSQTNVTTHDAQPPTRAARERRRKGKKSVKKSRGGRSAAR